MRMFSNLLGGVSDYELIELGVCDPDFFENFCYMLTLEIQIDNERKSYERAQRQTS